MIAIVLSLPLITLTLVVGIFLPGLALRLELRHRRERRLSTELTERQRIIDEQASTIDGYRQLVSEDERLRVGA